MLDQQTLDLMILEGLKQRQEEGRPTYSYSDIMKKFLCIRSGDESLVDQMMEDFPQCYMDFWPRRFSPDLVTNTRFFFIIQLTMASRVAIESGLDIDISMIIVEAFIQEAERCETMEALMELYRQMLHEYTRRTREARDHATNLYTRLALNYIALHIHGRLQPSDVARHVGISQARLNTMFQKDTGCGIARYIMDRKLERAKMYLLYSKYSILEISCLLGFASQSHFTKLFRERYQMTPGKYRQKTLRILEQTS